MWRSDPRGPAVIVDPYSSGALLGPAFTAAGVPVVAVVTGPRPPEVYASSYRPADYPEIITVTGDHGPAVDRLRQLRPRCVLPGCESGVELADAIAPLVVRDVANVPELAAARRHKGEMAAAVARSGLPIIEQICTDSPAEVTRWLEASGLIGHDLVIKPPKSASTDGVTRVRGGRGWPEVFDGLLGRVNRLGICNSKLLVQEYATGVEYVIDTFSYAGIHTVTDVCRYRKVDNGAYMAVYDSMDWLPPDAPEVDELTVYTRGVLDAVGLRYGAAHVEVMLTPRGCRLIEVGARAHGGGQPRFCRLATGDSQVDRIVRYFARLGPLPLGYELRQNVRVIFLISRSAGTVHNAGVLDGVRELDSHVHSEVHVRDGDRVEPTRDLFGSLDRGFVVLAHTDPDQIEADYRTVRQLERAVRVEPSMKGSRSDMTAKTRPLIILVTSGYHLYREYLLKLVAGAARVWLLAEAEPEWEWPYIVGYTVVDTLDPAAMIEAARAVSAATPVQGVLCWDEVRMVQSALVAQALGLPGGDPKVLGRCRDKHQTREALAAAGVPQASSTLVTSVTQARAAAGRIGYPVIVKPRALGASIGVSGVDGPDQMEAAYQHAREATEDGVPYYAEWVLVEEYLEGPEISVDAAWVDGELSPLFVARKISGFPPHFEEIGHTIDAADPLLTDADLLDVLFAAHQAVGFRNGMTHTELRLTTGGPKVVEINCRLGGDLIPYVGYTASGIDPGRVAVHVACGIRPDVTPTRKQVAAVRFFYPDEDVTVAEVTADPSGLPAAVDTLGVLAFPGQRLELPPAGHVACRYAYAVAVAGTVEDCMAATEAAQKAVSLHQLGGTS